MTTDEQKAREEFENLFGLQGSEFFVDEQGNYGYTNPFHHCMWEGYMGGVVSQRLAIEEKDRDIEMFKKGLQVADDKCIELQNTNTQLQARVKGLEKSLQPFAQFYCSEVGTCACNNCIARDLLVNKPQAKP